MNGLDSNQLANALGHLINKRWAKLAGVCARDEIAGVVKKADQDDAFPLCLISNTDTSKGDGEHWVALYLHSMHECEFFDSYGCNPSVYHIDIPCKHYHLANKRTLQSQLSSVCGHYCLFYLSYRSRGFHSDRIFHCFTSGSLRHNDAVVRRSVIKLLKRAPSFAIPHPCFTAHNQSCKCRDSCNFY